MTLRAFVLATSALAAACGGTYQGTGTTTGGTTTPTPTRSGIPQTLTLTATPTSIPADNTSTATLTAKLTDTAGFAMSGTTLTFTSNAGTLSAASAATGTDGTAVSRLKAGTIVGRATVTVRDAASGLSATAPVSFVAGPASTVSLSVAPTSVRPAGTVSVSITVLDAGGNPVSGEIVNLDVSVNASGGSLAAASVLTDSNGRGSTTYTAGTTVGSDTIRGRLASGVGSTANLAVSAAAAQIASVALTVGNTSPVASASVQTVVRAVVTDTAGQRVAGAVVNFSSTAGTIPATGTTDSAGTAQVQLTSPTTTGTATVRASTGGFTSSQAITFVAGPASTITMTATPSSLSFGQSSTLRATVLDANGNPVPSEGVTFKVTTNASGGVLSSASVSTDASGVATTSYQAGAASFANAIDIISAKVANGSVTPGQATLSIQASVGSMALSSASPTLIADGAKTTTLTATVRDQNGSAVSGAPVTCTTSAGTITPNSAVNTGSDGKASLVLKSSTTAGNAVAVCSIPGLSASVVVQFVAGAPSTIVLSASPTTVPLSGTSTVVATVLDVNSNVVSAEPVTFSLTANAGGSTLSAASITTDSNGRASLSFTSGTTAGTNTVKALTSGGITNTVNIASSATSQIVQSLTIAIGSNTSVPVASTVGVRATVLDTNGQPISGISVSFSKSDGTLSATSATSDSNGHADVNFTAPSYASPNVTVTASAAGLVARAAVNVVPGPADATKSSITANPSTVLADGASTTTITVVLNDTQGNPVADGRSVTLLSSVAGAGTFTPSNTGVTSSGRVTFTLQAPNTSSTTNISVQDLPALFTPVNFSSPTANTTGDPASIQFSASATTVSVAGVGQTEQLSITATVRDSAGNVIAENGYGNAALNNLRAEFITQPHGGETITGKNAAWVITSSSSSNQFVDVRTAGGVAVLTLHSGTIPGIVEIKFSVLKFTGSAFTVPADVAATGSLPQVSIASGPPTTIAFTHPITSSIDNLGGGSYRRRGQAIVTDRYGNHVPDGTVINLTLVDSVIAQGDGGTIAATSPTLTGGSSLLNRICTSLPPPSGGEASGCTARGVDAVTARDFNSTVVRNNAVRGIQANDHIYVLNADGFDKSRVVGSVTGANTVNAQTNYLYTASQPTAATAQYWIGSSLSGGFISGCNVADANCLEANLVTGTGTVFNGIAGFRVTYPANVGSILLGCYGYQPSGAYRVTEYHDKDKRDAIPQSRQVIIAASSGSGATGVNAGEFCFAPIAGSTLVPTPVSVTVTTASSADVQLELRDGGDTVQLPYVPIQCFIASTSRASTSSAVFSVSVLPNSDSAQETNVSGFAFARVSVTGTTISGDSANVTCTTSGGFEAATANFMAKVP